MTYSHETRSNRPRIALHIVMPDQVSGPNVTNFRLANSALSEHYSFRFFEQRFHANSRINLALIRDLRTQLREIGPDVVHLSGLQASGFHGALAARAAGCTRVLVTIHGTSRDALGIGRIRRLAFALAEWATLKLSAGFYTVCEDAGRRSFLQRHRGKYLGVVYNAAPEITFDSAREREEARAGLGVNADDFLVAVSGRMVYDKGLSYVVEAIQQIPDARVKFIFIGDGPYLETIRNEVPRLIQSGRVALLGKRVDVLGLLAGCDMFLFASLHENLSNALLEALAVGLPIVATNVGGNPEVISHGVNGVLISPRNSTEIASWVRELFENRELRTSLSRGAVRTARTKFSQEHTVARLGEIYESLLL